MRQRTKCYDFSLDDLDGIVERDQSLQCSRHIRNRHSSRGSHRLFIGVFEVEQYLEYDPFFWGEAWKRRKASLHAVPRRRREDAFVFGERALDHDSARGDFELVQSRRMRA